MNKLSSYTVKLCVWLAVGMLLYHLGVELMSRHWSSWKQVLVLDEELEDASAEWKGPVNQWLDVDASGQYLARTHNDGTIELWDLHSGEQLWRKGTAVATERLNYAETRAKFVGFEGDGLHVISNGTLTCYNMKGKELRELPVHTGKHVLRPEGSSVLVVSTLGENSLVIDLNSYKQWLVPGGLTMKSGEPRANIAADGDRVMLGNGGEVQVVSIATGDIVYAWSEDPLREASPKVDDIKQVVNRMDAQSIELEKEIVTNTERRKGMPTDARMTPDGKVLVLLFANYFAPEDPSERKTLIRALDIDDNEVLWETVRDGKCDELRLDAAGNSFSLRQMKEDSQILARYEVDTGTVLYEIPFSVVVERPLWKRPKMGLMQSNLYIGPNNERVVFTGHEPWIAKIEETPSLFPLYVSKGDVPLVRFSPDGKLVATYSASGVVRVFYLYGRETQGYLKHPLGWLLFFVWTIWCLGGMWLVWRWGRERPGLKMPGWLGLWMGLVSLSLAYIFNAVISIHARSLAELPWEASRAGLFYKVMLVAGVTYFTAFWLVKGANWSRIFHIVVCALKSILLMYSGLTLLEWIDSPWVLWVHEWWGTPILNDSGAYTTYMLLTWLGALTCLVILLSKDCVQWCAKLEEHRRERTLRELGQTEAVSERV